MGAGGPAARKVEYFNRLASLFDDYESFVLVHADFVGSKQIQTIRKALRAIDSQVIMGKNTIMRKVIRSKAADKPELEQILPYIVSNVGFIFARTGTLDKIKEILKENRVGAPAKAGVFAPADVVVPAGDTGLEPGQTSFMQALNIATKINKGQVQILNDVALIKEGQKVGSSEAALLLKLNIKPFSYGLEMTIVFDEGSLYEPKFLDMTEDDVVAAFSTGVANITAISLSTSVPTASAFPHMVLNAYKNLQAVCLATDYCFEQMAELKELLTNPEALAAAQAAAAAPAAAAPSGGGGGGKKAAVEEEKKEESEEDEDMGFGLFD